MSRAGATLSGFPEWTPAQRWVEQRLTDRLRHTFELHGFAALHTRSVEPLSQLLRKGESDKEIYAVQRLRDSPEIAASDASSEDRLGLHFDLTVPFARYVTEHAGQLAFPFKRYQIQQVWRGERPQEGRFREFTQADVDVVGSGTLPDHYEIDLPLVMVEALRGLDIGEVRVRTSNRRLAEGFLSGIGVTETAAALAAIDKLAKVGPEGVGALLRAGGATPEQVRLILEFASLRGPGAVGAAMALAQRHGAHTPLFEEGADRVAALLAGAAAAAPGAVEADLSITRGLDYYTGAVYETELVGHEGLGSICSGGRYDDLATVGAVAHPGVGLSIGVTRLVSRLFGAGLTATRAVPTCVVVAVDSDEQRPHSDAVARALRARGIPADTAPAAAKYGRQIRHADRLGVPYVWFCGTGTSGEVKDIRSGEQVAADADSWQPAQEDRWPAIARP